MVLGRSTMVLERSNMVLERPTMALGRYTRLLGRSNIVLRRSTMVLCRCTMVSSLVWLEYYSISAADMFVLVHSDFDHHTQTDRQTNKVFSPDLL